MKVKNLSIFIQVLVLAGLVLSTQAWADMVVYSAYKQAFPDSHPKCSSCHVDALPQKADGKHEWNAYGLAIKKASKDAGIAEIPTKDDKDKFVTILNKTGKAEDFKDSTVK